MNGKTRLSIIAIVIALAIVVQIGFIVPAHALTNYFNCITRIANKHGTLTLENVENCYDKVFKGAKLAQQKNNNTLPS
ncbi:MAG TPA: hypothetical protein VKA98_03970 [Nitrososphaeraceae archaeon]|jgi:hypothetical protein|nr:hypothetical protein [Nitrososphaeraceae archaeon]